MLVPTYATEPSYCLLSPYTLTLEGDGINSSVLPPFISIDGTNITILTNDPKYKLAYTFRVVAKENRSKLTNNSVIFTVKFRCHITNMKPIIDSSTVKEINYTLRSLPLTLGLPTFTWEPAECPAGFAYTM